MASDLRSSCATTVGIPSTKLNRETDNRSLIVVAFCICSSVNSVRAGMVHSNVKLSPSSETVIGCANVGIENRTLPCWSDFRIVPPCFKIHDSIARKVPMTDFEFCVSEISLRINSVISSTSWGFDPLTCTDLLRLSGHQSMFAPSMMNRVLSASSRNSTGRPIRRNRVRNSDCDP